MSEVNDAVMLGMYNRKVRELRERAERAERERDEWKRLAGQHDPESVRFGPIPAEQWEGNGPCQDCGGRSPYWKAPDDLWWQVMSPPGSQPSASPPGTICPVCFTIRGWKKGLFVDPMTWWTWTPIPPGFLPEGDVWLAWEREARAEQRLAEAVELLRGVRPSVHPSFAAIRAFLASLAPVTQEGENDG